MNSFLFKNSTLFNTLSAINHQTKIQIMKHIVLFLPVLCIYSCFACPAHANPFFNNHQNQLAFFLGQGVNHGFIIPPPTQWVPFNMLHLQYSQPSYFFRIPSRLSLNVVQTVGFGKKYGWNWDKYTIPIAILSQDIALAHQESWYIYGGLGTGMQLQQNERIGSKLIFSFKLGAGYHISDCTAIEVFVHHFSNGNTAPENNSYAFYGLGITYNF